MSERDCLEMEPDGRGPDGISEEARELITTMRSRLGGIESAVWNLDAAIDALMRPLIAISIITGILTAIAGVLVWGVLR